MLSHRNWFCICSTDIPSFNGAIGACKIKNHGGLLLLLILVELLGRLGCLFPAHAQDRERKSYHRVGLNLRLVLILMHHLPNRNFSIPTGSCHKVGAGLSINLFYFDIDYGICELVRDL